MTQQLATQFDRFKLFLRNEGTINAANRLRNTVIEVIGGGAVGSTICEQLPRYGESGRIVGIDPDTIELVNIGNQVFVQDEIGQPKVSAIERRIQRINPAQPYQGIQQRWSAELDVQPHAVFLCVDNIEVRKDIFHQLGDVLFFADFRVGGWLGELYTLTVENRATQRSKEEYEMTFFPMAEATGATCSQIANPITVGMLVQCAMSNFIAWLNGEHTMVSKALWLDAKEKMIHHENYHLTRRQHTNVSAQGTSENVQAAIAT